MKINIECKEIAEIVNGIIVGNSELLLTGLNGIEEASDTELTFYYNQKYLKSLETTKASCVLVDTNFDISLLPGRTLIIVENANLALYNLLKYFESSKDKLTEQIHPSAIIGDNCNISKSARIGAGVVIGDNCIIKDFVKIFPNVVIYDDVNIDENTIIHANSTIYNEVVIGKNCIVSASSVIGSDGFGYIEDQILKSFVKIPQLGNVIIEDDVEIGSGVTIDRALVGSTIIRKGTKIDNLVQVAHNCEIGENTAIASQTGISGSVKIGKRNRLAGQVGIAGHLITADDVTILAQSGVAKTITNSGIYFGSPIKSHLKAFKIEAVIQNLPELSREIHHIKKIIENLEK